MFIFQIICNEGRQDLTYVVGLKIFINEKVLEQYDLKQNEYVCYYQGIERVKVLDLKLEKEIYNEPM